MTRTTAAIATTLLWAMAPAQDTLEGGPCAARGVACADADGDGRIDVAVAVDGGTQRLYRNLGGGIFALESALLPATALPARAVLFADVDGDGDLDLVFACNDAANGLFVNDGGGRFGDESGARMPADRDWATCVVAGDIDADGDVDLLLGTTRNGVLLLRNSNRGRFDAEPAVRDTEWNTAAVVLADADGDGDLDVFAANRTNALGRGGTDYLLRNDGGTFAAVELPSKLNANGVATADLDGDGRPDYALALTGSKAGTGARNTVHLQTEPGSFTRGLAKHLAAGLDRTAAVAIGDADGDGDLDLAFANDGPNTLCLNDGSGGFRPLPLPGDDADTRALAFADLDSDGDLDLVLAHEGAAVEVLWNDGRGGFAGAAHAAGPPAGPLVPDPPAGEAAPAEPASPASAPAAGAVDGALAALHEDDAAADHALLALLERGPDAVPTLAEALAIADVESPAQQRAFLRGAVGLDRLGAAGAAGAQELIDVTLELAAHEGRAAAELATAALLALGSVAPWAERRGFEVTRALTEVADTRLGQTAAFARAWIRAAAPRSVPLDGLRQAVRNDAPFQRELAADLLAEMGATAAPAAADLLAALGSPPARIAEFTVAGRTRTIDRGVEAYHDRVADAAARALLALGEAPQTVAAHRHRLRRAARARWTPIAGAVLRADALASLAAIAELGEVAGEAAAEVGDLLDPAGVPVVPSDSAELELLRAALHAAVLLGDAGRELLPRLEKYRDHHDRRYRELVREALDALRGGEPSPEEQAPATADTERAPRVDFARAGGGRYAKRPRGRATMPLRNSAEAIERGLRWLVVHQGEDGGWDPAAFTRRTDDYAAGGLGAGNPRLVVGVTGLALLALLADANTTAAGDHADAVRRGVDWLLSRQDAANGRFGGADTGEFFYCHLIATQAVAEAAALDGNDRLREATAAAIRYVMAHRNADGLWRYRPGESGSDTSIVAWVVGALAAAADCGVQPPEPLAAPIARWLDEMTDPATGRTGYADRGGLSARRAGDHATRFPRENGEPMTAAALFSRLLLGQRATGSNEFSRAQDLLVAHPPSADPASADFYYWYWGSLAMHQLGGRAWTGWQRALNGVLPPAQRRDGDADGSWDPVGVWGDAGGRVYSTTMACLAMQAAYRFDRMVDPHWRRRR